jgi:hypothetical protein
MVNSTQQTGVNNEYTIKTDRPFLILVEGPSDKAMLANLMKSMDVTFPAYQIMPYGGKDKFKFVLKNITQQKNFQHITGLAILRDADESAANAFQSIRNYLQLSSFIPGDTVPDNHGEVRQDSKGTLKSGIFILPDGLSGGALEALLLSSLTAEMRKHIHQYIADAEILLHENARPDYRRSAKSESYAYSSLFEVENFRDSFQKHAWDWQHEAFEPLRQFLCGFKTD